MPKKKSNPVYSARIPDEVLEVFKNECERMGIPHNYVIQEYMKKFIVLNINRESYKSAILEEEPLESNNDLDDILDKE